ncbi:MAG: hypothetical protein ABGZ37_03460, partial [Akkermansiaceae bacterium]
MSVPLANNMIARMAVLSVVLFVATANSRAADRAPSDNASKGKPNGLFIAGDDLNDWGGCLGGQPQAKTPN